MQKCFPFSHLQRRAGQGREAARPRCGLDGFREGTKKVGPNKPRPANAKTLTQKVLSPLKLLEALRKSGCLLANFARPILIPPPPRKGVRRFPKPQPPLHNLHLYLFPIGAVPSPSSSINHDPLLQADQPVASSPLPAFRS